MIKTYGNIHGDYFISTPEITDETFHGSPMSRTTVRCLCGETFTNRLLSGAQKMMDTHTGYVAFAPAVHTADMLSM